MSVHKQRGRLLVSVLVPAYNEEANVERAYQAVRAVFEKLDGYDFELLFTDNHSTDRTAEILRGLAERDQRVRVIRFSRNFGYQRSLMVGYLNVSGDCAVQLDCDLQDPPGLIPEMLERWRNGYAVVYGVRRARREGAGVTRLRRWFYRLINLMSEDDLPVDVGDFRLVDRRVLDELARVDDATPYLRGLFSSMGFEQTGIVYDRNAREAGESKFGLLKMLQLALDGMLNHSLVPLRAATFTGLIVAVATLIATVGYLIGRLAFGQDWPDGFATTTVLLLLSIALNAVFLGIIGEYLGRIYLQVKRRPPVIVEERLNLGRVAIGATGSAKGRDV